MVDEKKISMGIVVESGTLIEDTIFYNTYYSALVAKPWITEF